ncbi:hypothetical protein C0584_05275 [Candidatus Parcubacteria bacterium]|nr:MAG: hypothetical protein C0584_05275 [Candidatus Parcubacteria bacterium]
MNSKFDRIIKLVKKTGDRIVVFDSNEPENAYAIMSLDEYEKISDNNSDLRGLTEDQMIDKINRDIALWKNDDNSPETEVEEEKKTEEKPKRSWNIPEERKKTASDEGENTESDDDEEIIEEDRQYLEEINY